MIDRGLGLSQLMGTDDGRRALGTVRIDAQERYCRQPELLCRRIELSGIKQTSVYALGGRFRNAVQSMRFFPP